MKRFVSLALLILTILTFASCSSNDEMNYFSTKFKYHNLEITVTNVDEAKKEDEYLLTTITFSAKNTGEYEYDFYLDDIYLKNTKTGEKYECQTTLIDSLFQEVVEAGETEEYNVKFKLPSSVSSTKYVMYFDFGSLGSPAGKCALYYEDDEMIEVSNSEQEYIEEIKRMQSDIYNIMKVSIYDKLDGSMSYSYVQNSMDNAERQIKTKISTFDISLDLSSGTMFPKWICSVRLNDGNTYPLMYISVDLDSTYHLKHKYIGTYNID